MINEWRRHRNNQKRLAAIDRGFESIEASGFD